MQRPGHTGQKALAKRKSFAASRGSGRPRRFPHLLHRVVFRLCELVLSSRSFSHVFRTVSCFVSFCNYVLAKFWPSLKFRTLDP